MVVEKETVVKAARRKGERMRVLNLMRMKSMRVRVRLGVCSG